MNLSDVSAEYGIPLATLRKLGKQAYSRSIVGSRVVVDSPGRVANHVRAKLESESREHFLAVLVDSRMRVVSVETIAIGSTAAVPVSPADVFRPAIVKGAAAIIVAHNHPSGDPVPSTDDIEVTKRLVKAGRILGIRVLDHVVVGSEGFVSMRERGSVVFS